MESEVEGVEISLEERTDDSCTPPQGFRAQAKRHQALKQQAQVKNAGSTLQMKKKVKNEIEVSINPSILIPFWLQKTGDTTRIQIQVHQLATHFSRT
ncbi:hypothetical protein MTO96_015039 [Rhipicephalus appendiculatus]